MITSAVKGPTGAKGDRGDPGPALTNRGRRYLRCAGVNTGYSTPDAAAWDITSTIDLRALVLPDSWNTGANQYLISKWGGTNCSYQLLISNSGQLAFIYSPDGSAQKTIQSTILLSTIGPTPSSGLAVWLRAFAIPNDGTGKAQASFYYSYDGSAWTLLDAPTNATPGPWFSGSANVYVGQQPSGGGPYTGRLYEAQVYNNTTLVGFFDARGASDPPATFTDTQSKVWTPLSGATLLADEVSDFDIRDKTIHLSKIIDPPATGGSAVLLDIPVVASDQPAAAKAAALLVGGYVCDGVADHVEIQAANDALAAVVKPSLVKFASGRISLIGQKFLVDVPVTLSSGIELVGQGSQRTKLVPSLTYSGANMVTLTSVNVERARLRCLELDGRKADGISTGGWMFDNTGGTFIVGPDPLHFIEDVWVHDCALTGAWLGVNCRGSKVINLDVSACGQHGFYCPATDCKIMLVRTSACGTDDGNMAYYGIGIKGSNNQVINFKANFQRGHNVWVDGTVCYLEGQTQDAWGTGLYLTTNSALVTADIGADSNAMQPQVVGVPGSDANIYDDGVQNTVRGISRDRGFAESQFDINGNVGNRTAYGISVGPNASRMNYDLQTRNLRKDSVTGTRTGKEARVFIQTQNDTVSDVQIVTLKNATGGTFTLTDTQSGQTTAAIAFSTTASTLQGNAQTALQALAALGANVTVNSASFAYQFKIVMGGSLANTLRSAFTVNGASLTGTSVAATVLHAVEGGARTSEARIANATLVTT